MTRFHDYLLVRVFTLVTDHKPLLGLLHSDRLTLAMAVARIQRWAIQLGGYCYKLEYKSGKLLLNAEALSKLPGLATSDPVLNDEQQEYVLVLSQFDVAPLTTNEIRELTSTEELLAQVKSYVKNGWPKGLTMLRHDLHPFRERKLELSVSHDLLYWGHHVVIPMKAREKLLLMLHDSHQGASAKKSIAHSRFWWPDLDREIESITKSCNACTQALPMPPALEPISWPQTNENWVRVHIDYAGPIKGKMILVLVDYTVIGLKLFRETMQRV